MTRVAVHRPVQPGMTNAQFGKLLIFINAMVPVALLLWDVNTDQTGPDKAAYILHATGMTALIFVMLTLVVTPLRKLTGSSFFMHFRRQLGLFAFFYACLHLLSYLQYQRDWNFPAIVRDVFQNKYIFFGMMAFALMIPLALTSTAASVKRMGAAAWKRLHKLVYVTAICAVIHYLLLVKADRRIPWIFAAVLGVLFALRIFYSLAGKNSKRAHPARPDPQLPRAGR
jgi:sulfoxide reductase heme-binding subunit YedZ